jgi:hypothetical protein
MHPLHLINHRSLSSETRNSLRFRESNLPELRIQPYGIRRDSGRFLEVRLPGFRDRIQVAENILASSISVTPVLRDLSRRPPPTPLEPSDDSIRTNCSL